MKRIIYIAIFIFFATSFVSCKVSDGDKRSTKRLASEIWNASKSNIESVRNAIEEVIYIDYLLQLNTEERDRYLNKYFMGGTLYNNSHGYIIRATTQYNTTISWSVTTNGAALGKGEWLVVRTGGEGYTLRVRPVGGGEMVAEFDVFYSAALQGRADINFCYIMMREEGLAYPVIMGYYEGEIWVEDRENNPTAPVYVNTTITEQLQISEYYGLMRGAVDVECIDEFYGAHDCISADISFYPRRVDVTCYGDVHTFYE